MKAVFMVFIGGGLGSVCRYLISLTTTSLWNIKFPLGTFLANMISCVVLAFIILIFKEKLTANLMWRWLLITGFCGGFSTFSTFSFESFELLKTGHPYLAFFNVLISVVLGIGILWLLLRDYELVH